MKPPGCPEAEEGGPGHSRGPYAYPRPVLLIFRSRAWSELILDSSWSIVLLEHNLLGSKDPGMALNPPLTPFGVPYAAYGEFYILTRENMKLTAHLYALSQRFTFLELA